MSRAIKIIVAVAIAVGIYFGIQRSTGEREKRRQEIQEFSELRQGANAKAEHDLNRDGVISPDTTQSFFNDATKRLDKLAALGGSREKEMKAIAELMRELQQQSLPYIDLLRRLEKDPPLDMSNVKTKADLATKREIGKEMLRLDKEIMSFIDSMEERMWKKLQDAGVATGSRKEFAAKTKPGFRKAIEVQRQIRKCDETQANALLGVVDLLEAEWGKWKWKDDDVVFEDVAKTARYTELMEEMQKASEQQEILAREMLNVQQGK